MRTRKRRYSDHDTSEPSSRTKRRTPQRSEVITISDDEEEPLESVLAKIKAQEESEALARKLQQDWADNAQPAPSAGTSSNADRGHDEEVIDLTREDDEALAKRLAKEWEALDEVPQQVTGPSKGKRKAYEVEEDHDVTPDKKLERYHELFIGTKRCQCGEELSSPRGHVTYSTQMPPPSLLRLLHIPCKKCRTNHCRGCLTAVTCPLSCKGEGKDGADTCPALTCCAEVRAIALFEALGGFDRQYLSERATSDSRAKEAAAKYRSTQVNSVGPGGTGYGTGADFTDLWHSRGLGKGRGRGGAGFTSTEAHASRIDELAAHWDEIVVRALTTITQFLPSQYSDAAQIYDMLPHASTEALLSLSQLPDLLGDLLRNDSVTDWISRIDVYHAMLALLRRMADCELTIEVLIGQRWEIEKSCGLEEWMWGDAEIVWEKAKDSQLVKAPPLYVHFKKLTKQCETFLAGASSMFEDGAGQDAGDVTDTMVKATSLCGDIIVARDDIERAMTLLGKAPSTVLQKADDMSQEDSKRRKGKAPDPSIALERTYAQECERLAFRYVTLSQPSSNGDGFSYPEFRYAKELAVTASSTRNPKDRLHLIKELAVMATSLPVGVWVRVDEVRNDAIKIMIAGPEGTPYAGGLFEFDCYIPLNYPNAPPLMHLRTTGGGRVRFNPNLYNNGKVCLSLLGTWAGRPEEQWSPKSTLLQVVVSIQSMILIDLPYFNEPGYGKADAKDHNSIAYNRNIYVQTVRWAMVEWMKDEYKNGIWAEVITAHFCTRHPKILKCIQEWAKDEPRIRKYTEGGTIPYDGPAFIVPPPYPSLPSGSSVVASGIYPAAPYNSILPVPSTASQHGKDLLQEYDRGIEQIQGWKHGQE
ncbi:Baculoviral IAP repeat-containing protein [Sparassis crispa]|uniref:Baculoviral IAP repeat-containing protein n=1 Tax=Sparassis crispa TaxID=139825 RepID=A0A401G520_9APHY|nr:Baculoviral IAP repeat-containing protein [Sparassis crispa]GBE77250.1 Baculoviral IAP repeat-containing protein [Sparassis crispa]